MPKNKGKKLFNHPNFSRALTLAEEKDQVYALVRKELGDRHMDVICSDGKTRRGKVCGKMRNRVWVHVGDIVLCSTRDFEEGNCDIILKYSTDEIKTLRRMDVLQGLDNVKYAQKTEEENNEDDIVFDDNVNIDEI